MENDAMRDDFADLLMLVQDQMQDLSAMQQKRSALVATANAADGTVEVSVDAQGMVTEIVIDELYLEEFDFAELGEHITSAVREAAHDVGRQAASLLEPLTQRRGEIRSMADIVAEVPELAEVLSHLNPLSTVSDGPASKADGDGRVRAIRPFQM